MTRLQIHEWRQRVYRLFFDGDIYIGYCYSWTRGKRLTHFQIIVPCRRYQYCSCEDFKFNRARNPWAYEEGFDSQCKHLSHMDRVWVIPAEQKREREEERRYREEIRGGFRRAA